MTLRLLATALTAAIILPGLAAAQPLAKELFGAEHSASRHKAAPFGSYAKGCLAGATELPETGPTWQSMRLSRNRNWAHPEAVAFIKRLSGYAATQPGWNGLYIGDISQPRGGPMLTGHRSHQMGLDIDIWMMPAKNLKLTRSERENLSAISLRKAKGAYVNGNWSAAHHRILKAAAKDPAVARIFQFPGPKTQLCQDETGDRSWLRKIRPWWAQHYHIHVRLACPKGARDCENQAPPPAGDGCDGAQEWVNNSLNPPPPDPNAPAPKPRREYVLADLPKQCAKILSR